MKAQLPVHVGRRQNPLPPRSGPDWSSSSTRFGVESAVPIRLPSFHEVDWARHEVEPRWLEYETSDCVAALAPRSSRGVSELQRLFAGAAGRRETVLLVDVMGNVDKIRRNVFVDYDASINLLDHETTIAGYRLPRGTRPVLADGLDGADRDLGLRLCNRPPDTWWRLESRGADRHLDGNAWQKTEPVGELRPILLDSLGAPVVAVWISPDERQRWYIVPDGTDWDTVIDWLVQRAVPAYVPDAPRRHRLASAVDPDLETPAETNARAALADLETRYARDKTRLEQSLADAKAIADPIRNGLLFGTGTVLVDTVARVLSTAGFTVDDLDARLGATVSADLLVTFGPHRRLVEVKSEGGNAKEALVGDLRRHMDTWGGHQPDSPVDGGTLIVNHQRKQPPARRSRQIYGRPEFVDTLTVQVVGTLDLFDWWRAKDWQAIRTAVLGPAPT
ncbi:hypothetical protein [Saccharothrix australiensis]|uniref:Uncharacterized protein n=1 Tax=Saccharothrix australiensis TaxID=2072 RepID=A0A495VR57_9PSEU|nr:hypothetical protein [Saccharothrix australiensis]RKT51876.1 hypothetical protein C8E97_0366 [Saccharothrix australiensis]